MTPSNAIQIFKDHAAWLKETWSMTPEGREYQEKFLEAIQVMEDLDDLAPARAIKD